MLRSEIIQERAISEAMLLFEKNLTIRETAKMLGIPKSTVFKDITERLDKNSKLYKNARKVLDKNKEERAIRGGLATRQKYRAPKVA